MPGRDGVCNKLWVWVHISRLTPPLIYRSACRNPGNERQEWTIQRNWQHWAHKKKTNNTKQSSNTICAGHHHMQTNTNNVNKTRKNGKLAVMKMCLRVSNLPLSTILRWDCRTVWTVWYFLFLILLPTETENTVF
jgi:hypothetical protein